jgi:hypothetical protein
MMTEDQERVVEAWQALDDREREIVFIGLRNCNCAAHVATIALLRAFAPTARQEREASTAQVGDTTSASGTCGECGGAGRDGVDVLRCCAACHGSGKGAGGGR